MDTPTEPLVDQQISARQQTTALNRWALLYPDKVPWRRILVEFVAIFTAVLLSFIAEDWREHLGDRRKEEALLRGLLQDVETDAAYFASATIPTDSIAASAGEWLQARWRSNPPADSVARAINGMFRGTPYAPARTEYEAARNSARLDLIRSPQLRRQINDYYEHKHRILADVWQLNWRFHFEWAQSIRPYVAFADTFPGPILLGHDRFTQDLWPEATLAVPWASVQADIAVYSTLAQTNTFRRLSIAWQRNNLTHLHRLRTEILKQLD
jgi:hypothetical protein